MPLYEYECEACGKRFEAIRRFSDPPLEACTQCGAGPVRRLLSSPAIQFKGSGWYITDYANKGKKGGSSEAGGDKKDEGTKDKGPAADASGKTSTSSDAPAPAPKSDAPAAKAAKASSDS